MFTFSWGLLTSRMVTFLPVAWWWCFRGPLASQLVQSGWAGVKSGGRSQWGEHAWIAMVIAQFCESSRLRWNGHCELQHIGSFWDWENLFASNSRCKKSSCPFPTSCCSWASTGPCAKYSPWLDRTFILHVPSWCLGDHWGLEERRPGHWKIYSCFLQSGAFHLNCLEEGRNLVKSYFLNRFVNVFT